MARRPQPPAIPTEADWDYPSLCLDGRDAYDHFAGKTRRECVALFEENSLRYQEDLVFMPTPACAYYIGSYVDYILSDAALGDSDGASCFVGLVASKADRDPGAIRPLWPEIEPALRRVVEQQGDFDAAPSIYGRFRERAGAIAARGFAVTFGAAMPDAGPESLTADEVARYLGGDELPWPVAIGVLRNSGLGPLGLDADPADVARALGAPAAAGAEAKWGVPHDWTLHDLPGGSAVVEFVGDVAVSAAFWPVGSRRLEAMRAAR